jgi:polar amino acid transport system substrate-binding protein
MDPAQLKQVRDPFFTTKREHGGTGLGLAICSRILGELGGELSLESTPGRGTTARVLLPVATTEGDTDP